MAGNKESKMQDFHKFFRHENVFINCHFIQARQGNRKEFEESLRCLRGKNADISAEAAQIKVCKRFEVFSTMLYKKGLVY